MGIVEAALILTNRESETNTHRKQDSKVTQKSIAVERYTSRKAPVD